MKYGVWKWKAVILILRCIINALSSGTTLICKVAKSPIVPTERKIIECHFSTNQMFLRNKIIVLSLRLVPSEQFVGCLVLKTVDTFND